MNNKFSKLIIFLLAACAMQTAKAENYSYLTLQYGGVQQSIALNTLKKITFSGGQLHATTAEGVQSIKLSTMEKMFFSATATAIPTAATPETASRMLPPAASWLWAAATNSSMWM